MNEPLLLVDGTDDAFHAWPADGKTWTEALWFGAWVPEQALSFYVYHWFKPALGIYGGGCLVWDAKAHLPWEIPFYQYDTHRAIAGPLDLRRLVLDSGVRVTSLEDGWRYRIEFDHPRVRIQMEFAALTPPDLTLQAGTAELFRGHLDQPGRYSGFIEIGGARHTVNCCGIRDRSWGPRVIADDMRLGYCHGESDQQSFLAFSTPGSDHDTVLKGFLNRDEERHEVVRGRRDVQFGADGRMQRIALELEDAKGRRLTAIGRPLNYFLYLPYPSLLSRHYLMRWELDGEVMYGEEQDLWSVPLWQQHAASQREGHGVQA
jgi:hypothetical protein